MHADTYDEIQAELAELRAERNRLRTAIFNTINDLGHKKPNLRAMRGYLSSVYNWRPDQKPKED